MTELVALNQNNQITTSSLTVAQTFGKLHKNVIQAIERLEIPEEFGRLNFKPTEREWINNLGKVVKEKSYEITRDGFTLLAMGFTGKKAMQFKIAYIEAFNKMEAALKARPIALPQSDGLSEKARHEIGGIVKRCCAVAVKETLATDNPNLANSVARLIEYIVEERAEKKLAEWKSETSQRVALALNGGAACQQ